LDSNAILLGKWIGNILSVRWGWLWLGVIYALGLLTGGLHPLALPLLVGAWIVYAFVVSGIGLWFSMVSRTTLRATLWTLSATIAAGVGHWLLWMCCLPLRIANVGDAEVVQGLGKFQVGFTPPLALGFSFTFSRVDFDSRGRGDDWALEAILYGVLGVVCWIVLGAGLAIANSSRFRLLTGRTPFSRPPRPGGQRRAPSRAVGGPSEAAPQPGISVDGEAQKALDVVAVEQATPEVRDAKANDETRPEHAPQRPDL
jgi:hypothetical protein